MTREEALALLGVQDAGNVSALSTQFADRQKELAGRLANAPTEGLRAKYQAALGRLQEAFELLSAAGSATRVDGLSRTQFRDLPSPGPKYTRGDGEVGGGIDLATGDVLCDRYEIRELIGQGGMGSVFRAYDRTRDEEVALKVLLPALISSEAARERFLSEGKISSKLSHPHIVNVFDVQRSGDRYFLTMELLQGQTLRQYLQRPGMGARSGTRTLSVEEALRLAQEVGSALSYAHRLTVHRDVKPENIWIETDGGYKLMDFGIARLLTGSQLTKTAMAIGSAYYMSPEQLREAKHVDGRADQYSLAVVLYEVICGEVPAGRAKSLSERVKGVPRGFSRAIDRALEARPDGRFADMDAFVGELSRKRTPWSGLRFVPHVEWYAGGALLLLGLVLAWPYLARLLPNPAASALGRRLSPLMVSIPAGSFQMGDVTGGGEVDELPVHTVSVKAFRLSKYELQWKYWQLYHATVPSSAVGCGEDPQEPVGCVSWDDAEQFIAWLNGKTGGGYRLPTEAEWEYAARAGTTTRYPWGDDDDASQRNGNDTDGHAVASGRYPPNAWGLYDMIGNVWEWVQDCYHASYDGAPTDGSAWESGACTYREFRGGAWGDVPADLRVSSRDSFAPTDRLGDLGFRLAQDE